MCLGNNHSNDRFIYYFKEKKMFMKPQKPQLPPFHQKGATFFQYLQAIAFVFSHRPSRKARARGEFIFR